MSCLARRRCVWWQALVGALLWSSSLPAAPPTLYSKPAYQSPVRGEPDDLLLLAGYGFDSDDQVVYRSIRDSTQPLPHPADVPVESSADFGTAEVVSAQNVPYSLTIKLPELLRAGQTYALWVRNAGGEWSEPVRINDARPYWITPSYAYESESVANLPRVLRVVGRNLQPAPGATTQVRLSGPMTVVLDAQRSGAAPSLDHYVAEATLPERLQPGVYRIQLTRDGTSWVDLRDQALEVRADPAPSAVFEVGAPAHGGCRADDGQDDVACIQRAIERAAAAGGGTVLFDAGVWSLSGKRALGPDGIVVPQGVSLRGAGMEQTKVVRAVNWGGSSSKATFTLSGRNTIQDLSFRDERLYEVTDRPDRPFFKLGPTLRLDAPGEVLRAGAIEDVVITQNRFDRTHPAIHDVALPIRRLFITYNEFGSYASSFRLAGRRTSVLRQFRVDDSVIRYNVFKPGSYLDVGNRQGALVGEIGAGHRFDFSNNTADGTATEYLYSPNDARGWRAAFFWHMANSHEQVLVAQNVATCTGDKVGDGESIAYDGNNNTFGFDAAPEVLAATANSVTVAGPLRSTQNGHAVALATYYAGHWIQIGQGPGLGQVRKIDSYRIDAADGSVTFKVSPAWDVVPMQRLTRISIGREYWQVYTVANTVDNRRPLCLKSNRSDPKAGAIAVWGQSADSAIEGNRLFDSDGILFQQLDSVRDGSCSYCDRGTHFINFVEIRGNLIDGEYDWNNDCSSSGIFGSLAASPNAWPLTTSYGLSISRNVVRGADGWRGGAITFVPTWHRGPKLPRQALVSNVLVHHNTMTELRAAAPRACRTDRTHSRRGISVDGLSLVARTVLYANSCPDATSPLHIAAQATTRVCPEGAPPSCDCSR